MKAMVQQFKLDEGCGSGLTQMQQRCKGNLALRPFRYACVAFLFIMMGAFFISSDVTATQKHTFIKDGVAFTLELPSSKWHDISRLDIHHHVEFINGNDPIDGYLRMRENCIDAGTTLADLARLERRSSLQHLSGYIDCREESFMGNYNGVSLSYEFTSGGMPMAGRIYFLQIDSRTIYSLHFTARRDTFKRIENEMSSIARSFRMK